MGNAPKTLRDAIEELEVAQDEIARLNQQVKDLKEEVRKVRSERDDYQTDYDAASDKLKTMQPIPAPCPICGSPLGEDVDTYECPRCAENRAVEDFLSRLLKDAKSKITKAVLAQYVTLAVEQIRNARRATVQAK